MNNYENVIDGLTILTKYGIGTVRAEHDVIYAGPNGGLDMSEEDCDLMNKSGWDWDDGLETWLIKV